MSSRLDKNSKLPSSGKAKESSTAGKAKASSTGAKPSGKSSKPAARAASSKPSEPESKAKAVGRAAASAESAAKSSAPRKTAPSRALAAKSPPKAEKNVGARAATRGGSDLSTSAAEGLGLEEFSIALIKKGETKERIWRTKNFHQMDVQREFGFPDVAPELPGQYHQDKLVLMPKDPEYMFCYWELTPNLIDEKAREKVPEGNYRETLKINWESRSLFEPNFTFIPVFFWARKWYFGVPQVGQRYQVELGWLSDTGHFISIIRSNLSELPESWAQTQKRLSEQGDVLAYTARNSKIIGSSEHLAVEDTRAFVPEWNLSSESFSSSSWSRGAGEPGSATKEAPSVAKAPGKPAKRSAPKSRSAPAARLEVSGKVLPGTKVTVDGKTVDIDGLGYFKTDFPYDQDILQLELTDRQGARRAFAYDLKELVLT